MLKKQDWIFLFTVLFCIVLLSGNVKAVTVPTNVIAYIPITYTNYNGISVATNTPLTIGVTGTNPYGIANDIIGFPSNSYSQYETCNLNNVVFFISNGMILNSWLEGNAVSEDTSNDICNSPTATNALILSGNTMYWIMPPNSFLTGNTGTATTNTLYMGFLGNVVTTSNTAFGYNSQYGASTGEAPQLSCSNPYNTLTCNGIYAQYDDGANVFTYYTNFVGSTLPNGVNTLNAGTGTFVTTTQNGIAFACTCNGGNNYVYVNTITYSNTNTLDALATQTNARAYLSVLFTNGGGAATSGAFGISGNGAQLFQINLGGTAGATSLNTPYVLTLMEPSVANQIGMANYATRLLRTTNFGTANSLLTLYTTSFDNGATGSGFYQWFRARTMPPGSVMPSTSLGAVVIPGSNLQITSFTTTNTLLDYNQYTTLTATIANGQSTFTYNFVVFNSITNTVLSTSLTSGSSSTTLSYTFQAASTWAGNTLAYNVIVKDSSGTTVNTVPNYLGFNTILATPILAVSVSIPSNQQVGNVINFNALSTTGTSPYTYNFLVYNSVTNTQIANDLTTTNSFAYTVPSASVGNTIYANVFVTDSASSNEITNSILTASSITLVSAPTNTITTFAESGLPLGIPWNVIYDSVTNTPIPNLNWIATNAYANSQPRNYVATNTEDKGNCVYDPTTNGAFITCIGGFNDTTTPASSGLATSNVFYTQVFSNGAVGTWFQSNTFPANVHGEGVETYNGYIYVVGGLNFKVSTRDDSGTAYNSVYYAQVMPGGGVTAWTATNVLPINVGGFVTAQSGNYIYTIGGHTPSWQGGSITANVYYAQIYPTGGVSAWTQTTNYPFAQSYSGCRASGGQVYCIGGGGGGGSQESHVYNAIVAANGVLSGWGTQYQYPDEEQLMGLATYGNTIIGVGGYSDANGIMKMVQYATITPSGAINSWTALTNYPIYVNAHGCLTYQGYIQCDGGFEYSSPGVQFDSINGIWYSAINMNTILATSPTATYTFTVANQIVNGTTYVASPASGSVAGGSTQTITFTALAGPTVTTSSCVTNAIVVQGQWESCTASATGGDAPYTYNFLISNTINTGTIANTIVGCTAVSGSCTATWFVGSNDIGNSLAANVIVHDAAANVFNSLYSATVYSAYLFPSVTTPLPSNTYLDAGQYVTYNTILSNGFQTFTVNLVNSNKVANTLPNSNQGTITFGANIPATGTQSFNVIAIDTGISIPVTFNTVQNTIIVNSILVAGAPTASNSAIVSGQYSTITAVPSGGTLPYSAYQWYTGAGCTSPIGGATQITYLSQPATTTTFYYAVTDSATTKVTKCSAGVTVTVSGSGAGRPTYISAPPANMVFGTQQTISIVGNPSTDTVQIYVTPLGQTQGAALATGTGIISYTLCQGTNYCPPFGYFTVNAYDTDPSSNVFNFYVYIPVNFFNYTNQPVPLGMPAVPVACTNNIRGGYCAGNVVYTQTTSLNNNLFAGNITINSGVTLWTNGYSIVASGNFDNLGAIAGNIVGNNGISNGGNFFRSYAPSGGAGNQNNGGNTIAGGGVQPSGSGAIPAPPVITNSLLVTWYDGGMFNFISGAGGGASTGATNPGGSGIYGVYIQANQLTAGFIFTNDLFSTGGGGGPGLIVLSYNSVYQAGTYNVIATHTATNPSVNGNSFVYQYITPPIAPQTFLTQYPYKLNTTSPSSLITYTMNQIYNNVQTVIQQNTLNINWFPPSGQSAGLYQYNVTETQRANVISIWANVSVNMTDVTSAFTYTNAIIQYFPNFAFTPGFAINPVSWQIKSDFPGNTHSNTITGDQWSNANITFTPNVILNYNGLPSFSANILNNPLMTNSITQNAMIFVSQNSIPSNIATRVVLNNTMFDLSGFFNVGGSRSATFNPLFNNYTWSQAIIFSTVAYSGNDVQTYMPLSNYQNPSITINNLSTIDTAVGYTGQTQNDYCPIILANGQYGNIWSYLPDSLANQYTMTVSLPNGNPANNYWLVVQSQSPNKQVLIYKMVVASGFSIFLEPRVNYRFLIYNTNCQLVYTTQYAIWSNPISISLAGSQVTPVPYLPQNVTAISSTCTNTPLSNNVMETQCAFANVASNANTLNWQLVSQSAPYGTQICANTVVSVSGTLTCLSPSYNSIVYSWALKVNMNNGLGFIDIKQGAFGGLGQQIGGFGIDGALAALLGAIILGLLFIKYNVSLSMIIVGLWIELCTFLTLLSFPAAVGGGLIILLGVGLGILTKGGS